MSETANIASDDSPRCEKCGLEITTGAMAAFCPNATQCEFWPHSDGTPSGDGAEWPLDLRIQQFPGGAVP